MGTITLSDEDEAILKQVRSGRNTVNNIASATGYDSAALAQRLDHMAENDLVRDIGQAAYDLTESGERVLNTLDDEKTNEGIDTSDAVERDLMAFGLPIEREESVRRAFTFVRSSGEATSTEIKDGVYDERPADYESADEWWEQCVRGYLADLPHIKQPSGDDDEWRYTGPKTTTESADGRHMLDSDTEHQPVDECETCDSETDGDHRTLSSDDGD